MYRYVRAGEWVCLWLYVVPNFVVFPKFVRSQDYLGHLFKIQISEPLNGLKMKILIYQVGSGLQRCMCVCVPLSSPKVYIVGIIIFGMIYLLLRCYFFKICFLFFWPWWVFTAAHRLSLVAASAGYSLLQHVGLSLQLLLLQSTGSRCREFSNCSTSVVATHGLVVCSSWDQLLLGMWDLLEPGIKPVSLAQQARFSTTGPRGKPLE